MSEPGEGIDLPPELLAELLRRSRPAALTPEEIGVLKEVARKHVEKKERWATLRANWPIITATVSLLSTILGFLANFLATHFQSVTPPK